MDRGHWNLEIYKLAHSLAVEVHKMTLTLPSHDRYEEGSQIRRSSKSISANIVEGYALRRYKAEFIRYLFRAYASSEETIEHLELLRDTTPTGKEHFAELVHNYGNLTGKILRYIQAVDDTFEIPLFMKEPVLNYESGKPERQTSNP